MMDESVEMVLNWKKKTIFNYTTPSIPLLPLRRRSRASLPRDRQLRLLAGQYWSGHECHVATGKVACTSDSYGCLLIANELCNACGNGVYTHPTQVDMIPPEPCMFHNTYQTGCSISHTDRRMCSTAILLLHETT
jgi:hypothetical protein